MKFTAEQLMRLRDIDNERARCISQIILLKKEEDAIRATAQAYVPTHPRNEALPTAQPKPMGSTQDALLLRQERERAARRRLAYFQNGRA